MAKMNKNNGNSNNNSKKGRNNSNSRSNRYDNRNRNSSRNMAENSTNDPNWYAADPALLRDAASYPFSQALGTSIHMTDLVTARNQKDKMYVPGICAISLAPSVGYSEDATSPLNVAATSMYSFVRHANSGHANADVPDMMLYCLSMSSIYSFINFCQRLYGLSMLYTQRNRYIPRGLVEAQNIDFDSVVQNLSNFRFWINTMISKASSLAVPANMPYFTRAAFLYQNVYCEGSSVKDQLYMYRPAGFYRFKWDDDSAGMLEFAEFAPDGQRWTVDQIYEYGNSLLDSIIQDEEMNIISGDVLKAYQGDIIKLMSLPEVYPIVPICDPMVLTQMKNATPVGADNLDVKHSSDKSCLVSMPTMKREGLPITTCFEIMRGSHLVTVDSEDVPPEVMMEATRLSVGAVRKDNDYVYLSGGSELPVSITYYTLGDNGFLNAASHKFIVQLSSATLKATMVDDNKRLNQLELMFRPLAARAHFKYAPMTTYVYDSGQIFERFYDVDNYTVLDAHDLSKLHEAATMNMLAVPSIAKVQRV